MVTNNYFRMQFEKNQEFIQEYPTLPCLNPIPSCHVKMPKVRELHFKNRGYIKHLSFSISICY